MSVSTVFLLQQEMTKTFDNMLLFLVYHERIPIDISPAVPMAVTHSLQYLCKIPNDRCGVLLCPTGPGKGWKVLGETSYTHCIYFSQNTSGLVDIWIRNHNFQTPVLGLGLGVYFTFALDNNHITMTTMTTTLT